MKLFFILFFSLACTRDQAKKDAHQEVKKEENSLISNPPTTAKVNEMLSIRPIENHHFNINSPIKCGAYPPIEKTPRLIKCQFYSKGNQTFKAGICDEKETFCKVENHQIEVTGEDVSQNFMPKPYESKVKIPTAPGFILNDPEKALAILAETKGLILIDFFGIWCPPCNMLDEFVFDKESFVENTKEIVKIKVDVDSEQSWEWKDKFKIQGYPTLIIANSQMEEISRLVGYRNLNIVNDWVKKAVENKDESIEKAKYQLEKKSLKDKKKIADLKKRLGIWYHDRGEFAEAKNILGGLKDSESRKYFLLSELNMAEKADKKDEVVKTYEILLTTFSQDVEALSWLNSLMEYDKTVAAKYIEGILTAADVWKKSPDLEKHDWSRADLAVYKAMVYTELDKKEEAKKEYNDCSDYYFELKKKSALKVSRGANQELAYCLYMAERNAEAKKIYEELAKEYDTEFTFNFYYANLLKRLKEFDKALEYATKAAKLGYGDNWLRSVGLKAELEIELKKIEVAKVTLDEALKEVRIPKFAKVGTHRHIEKLRTLQAKVQ